MEVDDEKAPESASEKSKKKIMGAAVCIRTKKMKAQEAPPMSAPISGPIRSILPS